MEAFVTQLAVGLLTLGCTAVISIIGTLLLYQLKQRDKREDAAAAERATDRQKINDIEIALIKLTGKTPKEVAHGTKRGSDVQLKVTGGDSA